jgi:hypothetical protein
MRTSKRQKVCLANEAWSKSYEKLHPQEPSAQPQYGPEEKERLEKIYRISGEILHAYSTYGCGSSMIHELSVLASFYGEMEIDRCMMLHWFEKYEKFKHAAKKQDAWEKTRRQVHGLNCAANRRQAHIKS